LTVQGFQICDPTQEFDSIGQYEVGRLARAGDPEPKLSTSCERLGPYISKEPQQSFSIGWPIEFSNEQQIDPLPGTRRQGSFERETYGHRRHLFSAVEIDKNSSVRVRYSGDNIRAACEVSLGRKDAPSLEGKK
jgi:hypothetical protein